MFCHQFSSAQGWFSALLLSAFMVKALMHLSYGPVLSWHLTCSSSGMILVQTWVNTFVVVVVVVVLPG